MKVEKRVKSKEQFARFSLQQQPTEAPDIVRGGS
jgi:hypothetical protein